MKTISIEDITEEMIFQPAKAFTEIIVQHGKNHRVVRDSNQSHVGIAYPKNEKEGDWDNYRDSISYLFWKQYEIVQVIRSKQL